MTMRVGLLASLALALLLGGTACSNKEKDERASLISQNDQLKKDLDAERAARQQAEAKANMATAQATTMPEVSTPGMEGGVSDMTGTVPPARGKGSAARSSGGGEVVSEVIELPGDILFPSGKATLTAAGKKELDKAAATLKSKYAGHLIRLEGYTDPNPVRSSGWDDNWDLGAARANSVRKYLDGKGVKNMYIASFGPTKIRSSSNMAANRRVDIVVLKG
jgi:flagellar motor protein MotB